MLSDMVFKVGCVSLVLSYEFQRIKGIVNLDKVRKLFIHSFLPVNWCKA